MPNHLHLILYVESKNESFNQALADSEKILAYEIIKRLKASKNNELIQTLKEGVQPNKPVKSKKHQIFHLSFDAKEISEDEVGKVLDYIHHNPVKWKWNLAEDYTLYPYSSAGYYENSQLPLYKNTDFRKTSESSSSDSE